MGGVVLGERGRKGALKGGEREKRKGEGGRTEVSMERKKISMGGRRGARWKRFACLLLGWRRGRMEKLTHVLPNVDQE